jgi:dephospho-CoA kinase
MSASVSSLRAPYAVLVIPLLIETGQTETVDRVLVIDAPVAVQRNRLKARDASDERQIDQILASQVSRERRLAVADDVIDNSGDLQQLEDAVRELHHDYLRRAKDG